MTTLDKDAANRMQRAGGYFKQASSALNDYAAFFAQFDSGLKRYINVNS